MNARLCWIRRLVLALAALAGVSVAEPAAAWSELGHRVVADLAYQRLTPAARAQVDALIGVAATSGEPSCPVASLADAAVFPDCVNGVRRYNELRRLHFEARPFCPDPKPRDYCKDGQCLTAGLKRALAILGDPAAPAPIKLYALEQAAHFMADLHQPLDLIDNRDEQGAEIRILLPGGADKRLNLHDFWNDIILAPALGGEEIGVHYLEPLAARGEQWRRGDVDAWAAETYALARGIYEHLPEPPQCGRRPRMPEALDRGYVLSSVPTVREQLAKAAVRLASVLNEALR